MNPNALLKPAPSTVMVDGAEVPIATSHRTGIRAMQAAEDPALDGGGRAQALLLLYFGAPIARHGRRALTLPNDVLARPEAALEAALDFLNLCEPQRPSGQTGSRRASKMRTWDWDHDAPRLVADFQREYGVDLTDPALDMHWWRFWPLFRGLSDSSLTMQAMAVRGADPGNFSGEERTRLIERQRALALPARTEEEALRLTSLLWGLDV